MLKKKLFTLLAVAGLVFASAPIAQAAPILSDGHEGDYRIIFQTLGTHGAKDTTIGPYNTFVTTEAGLAGSTQTKDLSTTWTTVGSTSLTDTARVNTGTTATGDNNIHIYTPSATLGTYTLVATNYDDLWDGSIATGIRYADGTESNPGLTNAGTHQIWTGSLSNGAAYTGGGGGVGYLGSSLGGSGASAFNIALARGGYTNGGWIFGADSHDGEADNGSTYEKHFMGISGVISATAAVPEPATATLALLGLGGLMMRRRRNRG